MVDYYINGWNNNTVISFLNFISMLEKFFLNLTCWELTRHFMKLKNYTKFFGCKIERMHGGWHGSFGILWLRTWPSLIIYPCGKYALVNVSHVLFILQAPVHLSFWSFGKEITTKEANCLRPNSETFGFLEIAFFNKISLSWQDKRMKVF